MIKFENGRIQANGSGAQLCMELSFLTKSIRENIADSVGNEYAGEKVKEAFKNSELSYEEIMLKYIERKKEAEREAEDLLRTILFGGGK